jgi:hypothetical protein
MTTKPNLHIGTKLYKIIIYPSWLNGGIDIKEIEIEAIKIYKNDECEYFYDVDKSFRDEDINKEIFASKKEARRQAVKLLKEKLKDEIKYIKILKQKIKRFKKCT